MAVTTSLQNPPKFSNGLTSQSQYYHLFGVTNGMAEMAALWPVPTPHSTEMGRITCPQSHEIQQDSEFHPRFYRNKNADNIINLV